MNARLVFLAFLLIGSLLSQASELLRDLAAGRSRKVVVYGTSLTAGGPWVDQMKAWLSANYSGTMSLVNSGLSGKNSAEGVAQLSSKVLALHPDTVFLEFAVNDAFLYSDGTPQLSVADARANLIAMIDAILAQNPKAEIILQTMNSVWDSPAGSNQSATLRPNLPAYYQMYRDVAAERGLLLIDHHPNWVTLQTNNLATFQTYIPDGVHPIAAATQAITMPLLQRRLIGTVNYHPANAPSPTLLTADVCVYGGTSGAVASAVQAARLGKRVIMLSADSFLGGLSSNGLGWTDIGSASAIGGISREFYTRIYNYYLNNSAWNIETRDAYISRSGLDPDTARKMMFTFEPRIARQIFDDFMAEAGVTVVRGRLLRSSGGVKKEGRRIREIMTDDGRVSIRAAMFIDATYEGDLLAAAGVSYSVGRESNATYGETLNGIQTANSGGNQLPNAIDPYLTPGQPGSGLLPGVNANAGGVDGTGDQRLQAYTFRMCLTDVAANRAPVPKPAGYQENDYELLFRAIAAGQTNNFFKTSPMPNRKTDSNNSNGYSTDFIGGNYNLAEGWNYAEADYARRDEILAAHIRYQQGFVWALQNSPRVPAGIRSALASWGLPLDEFTETGNWPAQLYVREARRLVGEYVITQKDVNQQTGFVAPDSVGMGGYNMDSHHTQRHVAAAGVKNEGDVQVAPSRGPYGISYRAMVPKATEVENLLVPVCVSSSHIAFGSIRMEPVFMILGQSAGMAAVRALNDDVPVQQVDYSLLRRDLMLAGQVVSLATPPSAGEIILDNTEPTGVTISSGWTGSSASPGYYGSDYLHDSNTGQGTKTVRYTPTIPQSGTYEVFARWTTNANRATNVRYDIVHAAGTTTPPLVNQQVNNGVWVSLGSYQFNAGTSGSVLLRTDGANGYVIADAVRFVPPGALPSVSIIAPVPATTEGTGDPGVFTVFRDGAGSAALTVQLAIGGSASVGDYKTIPTLVTIPAGKASESISVQSFVDVSVEGSETVVASVVANAAYTSASPVTATVTIIDPPFDFWKAANFTPEELGDPQISGDTSDADGDGRSNFAEYLLSGDPRNIDAPASPEIGWASTANGPQLCLYYAKREGGFGFEVQQSTTLAPTDWTHEGVGAELYDATSGLYYQAAPINAADTVKFLRLQMIKP
ncbi:MAG TPA: FAD-dependent oxidoreductase [Chthoniobacteraceae bacterium]|nr:FAD-dependent oxidoreductase [Chthoniobacteraceae bacterium]